MSNSQDELRIKNNNAERTPCALVIDVSGSMNDEAAGTGHSRIQELNTGIRILHDALRTDPEAVRRVEIALITVGGENSEAILVQDFSTVNYFAPPVFEAGGGTPLGEGVMTALDALDARRRLLVKFGRSISRPWMFVISDGEPTDEEGTWQAAAKRSRAAVKDNRCLVYPILIEGVTNPRLAELSEAPPTTLRAANFASFFRWVSVTVSRPIRSETDVPNPSALGQFSKVNTKAGSNVRPLR